MKLIPLCCTVLVGTAVLLLEGCAGFVSQPIASSGRSGCNNIDMADADMRNDPANGLTPVPKH